MVVRKLLILLIAFTMLGCASKSERKAPEIKSDLKRIPKPELLAAPPPAVIKKPEMKHDPLADIFISVDAVEETLSSLLYMIASEAGLNLIISSGINSQKPFTISINSMPAREALDVIAESAGVHYELSGSTVKISAVLTKTFNIPQPRVSTTQESEIGGDVFGSTESNLKGDYSLKYNRSSEMTDLQAQITQSLFNIIFWDDKDIEDLNRKHGGVSGVGKAGKKDEESSFFRGAEGYLFNSYTGVLKVTTTPQKMRMVESYLNDILAAAEKQVLIEARLVEVVLNDTSAYGINWRGTVDGNPAGLSLGTTGGANKLLGGLTPVGTLSSNSLASWFAFMATFGKVESISNPRLRVMNGQSAMISSGQLIPYWEMEREEDTETDEITVTYSRVTVLDGVIMGVTAHIRDDETITLNIIPVFSDVESVKTLINEAGETVASYPVINLKEAGTVLNVKSGSTIILGGLISNVETEQEEKMPLLGDIPILGYLFKGKSKAVEKRELVIFLKTTIING